MSSKDPRDKIEAIFAKAQEAARKDIERILVFYKQGLLLFEVQLDFGTRKPLSTS